MAEVQYDEIGIWSEVKLAIIKEYAAAYSTILDATQRKTIPSLRWLYIDAFAGPGVHLSKTTREIVDGSPLIALKTTPPFSEYHFIDADKSRADQLRTIAGAGKDIHIYSEDCNRVLLRDVFPKAKYGDYRRALCLLDPYNINLKWEVSNRCVHWLTPIRAARTSLGRCQRHRVKDLSHRMEYPRPGADQDSRQ
jgi:three-Cys-motif partner protein